MRTELHTRGLSLRAASIDTEARTVDAVLATERPVEVYACDLGEVVDEVLVAEGARFPGQLPLLDSHNRHSVRDQIGSIVGIRQEADQWVGRLRFADTQQARDAFALVEGGHLRDVSIGYRVREFTDIAPGESQRIAGREYTAGAKRATRITTQWEVKEGSLTPIGADEHAKVRAAAQEVSSVSNHDSGPAQPDEQAAVTVDDESARSRERAIEDRALAAERKRVGDIHALPTADRHQDIVREAVTLGWSASDTALCLLQARADSMAAPVSSAQLEAPTVVSRANGRNADETLRALSYGMRHQLGGNVEPDAATKPERDKQERAAEDGLRFRDYGLSDIMAASLEAIGVRAPRGKRAVFQEWIRHASSSRSQGDYQFRAVGTTTMDLANVFTDTWAAELVRHFQESTSALEQLSRPTDVADFRSNERPRALQLPDLVRLQSGGIAEHMGLSDIGESYQARRYAGQVVIDEQDVINDRFDLFASLPQRMGIAARRIIGDLLAYRLINGNTDGLTAGAIFASGNGSNTDTNTLTSANLISGVAVVLAQTEAASDGRAVPLNIQPKFLVVPPALVHTAKELINSSLILVAGSTDTVRGNANTLANSLEIVMDNRLGVGVNDPVTGTAGSGSTTAWFLAADPIMHPVFETGFVRGTGRLPRLRSAVLDKGQYGISYDVSIDVGVKALAYQGLYRGNT